MKRRLLILAAFLLAGAVVNVGVAWGCAVSIRLSMPASPPVWAILREVAPDGSQQGRPSQHQPGRARRAEPELWHIWGIERIKLRGALFFCSFSDARYSRGPNPSTDLRPAELAPSWAQLRTPPDTDHAVRWVQAFGWPVVSLWRDYGSGGHFREPPELLHGLRVTFLPPDGAFQRAVPINPAWPGFAVNTLFYAIVLWLLIPGPFALRRFIRMRRGLCPACAYPRGESAVCSECGKALPQQAHAPLLGDRSLKGDMSR